MALPLLGTNSPNFQAFLGHSRPLVLLRWAILGLKRDCAPPANMRTQQRWLVRGIYMSSPHIQYEHNKYTRCSRDLDEVARSDRSSATCAGFSLPSPQRLTAVIETFQATKNPPVL